MGIEMEALMLSPLGVLIEQAMHISGQDIGV